MLNFCPELLSKTVVNVYLDTAGTYKYCPFQETIGGEPAPVVHGGARAEREEAAEHGERGAPLEDQAEHGRRKHVPQHHRR